MSIDWVAILWIRQSQDNQWRIQGFPDGRGGGGDCEPLRLEQKPIILQDFCRKMHENKRNWTFPRIRQLQFLSIA